MKELLMWWAILFLVPVFIVTFGHAFTTLSLTPLNPANWQPFTRFLTFAWFVVSGFWIFSASS